MKNQFYVVKLFFSFFLWFLNHQCAPTKLNGPCDPKSESFLLSALLEFGSTDETYLCPIFSGLNPLRVDYGTDFLVFRQGEPIVNLNPYTSEPIEHCESTPALPQGVNLNESTCAISGIPIVGMNSTKYFIFAKSRSKQTTIPLVIKSLFASKFVFVGSELGPINSYTINQTSGALNAGANIAGGVTEMEISPNQKYLTITSFSTNTITQLSINPTNGNLTLVGSLPSGGTPISIAYHPTKELLYLRNDFSITTFSVDLSSGDLNLIDSLPMSYTGLKSKIEVEPFGNYLYSINSNGNMIDTYRVDPISGLLNGNPIQSISTVYKPNEFVNSATGKSIYTVNSLDNNVSIFQIDTSSGILNTYYLPSPTTGVGLNSIVGDPTGRFVYGTNTDSETVAKFGTNPVNGDLYSLLPFTTSTGALTRPMGIATDTQGRFLYITNFQANNVGIYLINQNDGSLIPNGTVGSTNFPTDIVTAGVNP
ncbi:lactonase family protein [Leptospira terpstrae]|uniref:Lactonase, 7-bladed beta-propeller domain protein n=1 Tax=Leptospira terpstrae serovar Hualin str. LT 11-33 = ATCC 700639 TaxID=1257025 RepID=N1VRT0_9LEPT|nr:beta-propeller fold lactonase family protein [Leptospira terpstrae]EMY62424.1 lactonase, 7-bladed beta-propeller domain protein [Leptospira terpstrae serovar Hualin str. LT 11-33 = ATCC 700639]